MSDPLDSPPPPLPPKAPSWRPEPKRRRIPLVFYLVAAIVATIVAVKFFDLGLRALLGHWIESEVCKVLGGCESYGR